MLLRHTPRHHCVDARACLNSHVQRYRVVPVRRLQDETAKRS